MSHQSFFRHAFDSGGHMSASALCRALSRGILFACVLALLVTTPFAAAQSATPVAPSTTENSVPELIEVLEEKDTSATPETSPLLPADRALAAGTPVPLSGNVSPQALGDLAISIKCTPPSPLEVPRGGTVSFPCHFDALLGASLLGGTISLEAQIDAITDSSSAIVSLLSEALPCTTTTAALSICLTNATQAQLAQKSRFTVEIKQSCPGISTPASYNVTLSSSLHVAVRLPLLGEVLSIPLITEPIELTVQLGEVIPLAVSAEMPLLVFQESYWTGSSYSQSTLEQPLRLAVSPPSTGCLAPGSTVSISGKNELYDDFSGESIPHSAVSITSVSDASGASWGNAISEPGSTLDEARPVFQTNQGATTGTGDAEVIVDLALTPPSNAPPGDYEGTIVITSSIDGPND